MRAVQSGSAAATASASTPGNSSPTRINNDEDDVAGRRSKRVSVSARYSFSRRQSFLLQKKTALDQAGYVCIFLLWKYGNIWCLCDWSLSWRGVERDRAQNGKRGWESERTRKRERNRKRNRNRERNQCREREREECESLNERKLFWNELLFYQLFWILQSIDKKSFI